MVVEAGAPAPGVGAVLNGRWQLLRVIGEGGLAAVYEAEGLRGERRAIKLLHPQFQAQRNIVERFYAEAKACYALRHPNIAAVEEYAYAEDGRPYIVMELLVGQSLDDYLRTHSPMRAEQAAHLVAGVLEALSAAHAAGIVHRDLKPPNLFLVEGAGGARLKVLDFGIAKVMDLAGGMGARTRTGALLGTPGYMSPEQIKDAKNVDARTDLWALGVVLYEMLTHRHPFGSDDHIAQVSAILQGASRPVSELAPELAAWDGFFQQALARDPGQRFQSAAEMAARLRDLARPGQPATKGGTQQMPALPAALSPELPRATEGRVATLSSEDAGVSAFGGSTQLSPGRPRAISQPPPIGVETAAPLEPPSLVWWGVVLIGLGAFAAGILCGYLLAQ